MKRRQARLPLHGGRAPAWLFQRMVRLAGAISAAVVEDYGPEDLLTRLGDPWWFQAFGCVLGFDWHSSGLTTVTCGALKEAGKRWGDDLGIVVAGGKGATSRKAPAEIAAGAERLGIEGEALVHASKLSAKVDSAALQDGFSIYHHSFLFAPSGAWAVVQQGKDERWARRYHWVGERVQDFVCEPHEGVADAAEGRGEREVLNLIAASAVASRRAQAQLVLFEDPDSLVNELERITEGPTLFAPDHHPVYRTDVNLPRLRQIVRRAHEVQPRDFVTLLGTEGVGPATLRALALLAELIHGASPSLDDVPSTILGERPLDPREARQWADYSYAHGGKDGHPFPVDRETYDKSIDVLESSLRRARVDEGERHDAFRRLALLGGAPQREQVALPARLRLPADRAAGAPCASALNSSASRTNAPSTQPNAPKGEAASLPLRSGAPAGSARSAKRARPARAQKPKRKRPPRQLKLF